jgi:hypothetical protein
VIRGQYRGHLYGELNLVGPLNKGAELKGLQGWQRSGWTAPDPGSRHYPEVRAGAAICVVLPPTYCQRRTAPSSDDAALFIEDL